MQKIKQDMNLGANLQKLRKKSNLTQEAVVIRCQLEGLNISRSIYSQMEAGTYNVRVSELTVFKKIYDATWDEIFEGFSVEKVIQSKQFREDKK